MRRQAQLDWWLARCAGAPDPRGRVLALLALGRGETPNAIEAAFAAGRYSPEPLGEPEHRLIRALAGNTLDADDQPPPFRPVPHFADYRAPIAGLGFVVEWCFHEGEPGLLLHPGQVGVATPVLVGQRLSGIPWSVQVPKVDAVDRVVFFVGGG